LATGYEEVLTHKGQGVYKTDPHLASLGLQGPDAYLKDENGNPVPETILRVDPKTIRRVLEREFPDTYGKKKRKIDTKPQGGVLVLGGKGKKQTKKFDKELLNESLFLDLDQARQMITAWATDFNTRRPHSSLGYKTPAAYADHLTATGHRATLHGGFARCPVAHIAPKGVSTAEALIATG
jgi:transposase InsO family protein